MCPVLVGAVACSPSTHGTGARVHSAGSSPGTAAARPEALTAQLLTAGDLPAGWRVSDSSDPASLPAPPCVETAITALQTATKARVQLVKNESLPLLEQQIGHYASSTDALTKFDTAVAAVDACRDFTFDYQGVKATGSIARLSFGSLGDRSTAWHITLNAMGLLATGNAVLIAKGSELELLIYLNLGNTDPRDFAPLALAALAKMPS